MPKIPKKRKLPKIPKKKGTSLTSAQKKKFIKKAKEGLATFKKFKFLIPPIGRKKKLKAKGILPDTLRGLKKGADRKKKLIESIK